MISRRQFVAGAAATIAMATEPTLAGAETKTAASAGEKLVFPREFLLGVASSSYQIEGAAAEDGKGESIWDRWVKTPDRVKVPGNVAADHYHHLDDDIAILRELGVRAYRFSISWPRVMPEGRGTLNPKGIAFYRSLITKLNESGIKPFATLYHWELPQPLQDLGGWANPDSAAWFEEYSQAMFLEFGETVPYWTTFNEPWVTCFMGYLLGTHPPGIRDLSTSLLCTYNLLRAHGRAVRAWRASGRKGEIGITLDWPYTLPATDRPEDAAAATRINQSHHAWFAKPIFKGDFPEAVWKWYADHGAVMPKVDASELRAVSTPVDFLGLNYYQTDRVKHDPSGWWPYETRHVEDRSRATWGNPDGLRQVLRILDGEYKTKIIITENGRELPDEINGHGEVVDDVRIDYIYSHLAVCHEALNSGVRLAGYFNWSFLDDYEWGEFGRMGLVYVDFETEKRVVKRSGRWFKTGISEGFALPAHG